MSVKGAGGSRNCRARSAPSRTRSRVRVLKELRERLKFLVVGLEYHAGARVRHVGRRHPARLADGLGAYSRVCHVLDEPSIGLHQRDNARLLETLKT